ncbi:hydroxymethylglutaryl-CoA lyase [Nitratireductor kimnyeongensis]|uniref:Hydroxymethylglutaryl-CoA lyase n=1 Tax=Nitratireductor kimnyeongensis TaxID=430679 RepID=A0ABW0T8F1_9HYPH|nr:hydroxymethylglutaryl-CoA lyase [Nitratireductor kimnyeongensis]QZZ34200.1 hydroxymethylglutaryl-CoA lyase [Nitratireductor kimnyeongensis]
MSTQVSIVEVAPRDGLQARKEHIETAHRIELVERLRRSGVARMEVGAFVSPQRVPRMADTAEVMNAVGASERAGDMVLVANERGLEQALEEGARAIAVFTAASDAFAEKNIGSTVAASLERFALIVTRARYAGVFVRGYVSTITDCPYAGPVDPIAVAPVAKALRDMGCQEIALGETLGKATPARIAAVVEAVAREVPISAIAAHFHDTYGMGIANVWEAVRLGIRTVDAAAGGLGGCPFAPGAAGNVATEDVVYLLNGQGMETGIALDPLLDAVSFCATTMGIAPTSRVYKALRSVAR